MVNDNEALLDYSKKISKSTIKARIFDFLPNLEKNLEGNVI